MRDILKGLKQFDIDLRRLRSANFYRDLIKDRGVISKKYASCLLTEDKFRCPLCGGASKTLYMSHEGYNLYECSSCSAVSPNLDLETLEKINFHASKEVEEDLKREILSTFDYRKNTFGKERLEYFKELIPSFGKMNERVLDVGCGPGYVISVLKDAGIAARGLEINPTCISFAKEKGLDVVGSSLADEPDSGYSLVTMFDVLEHIANPVSFMSEVASKVSPEGFVLAYTPNLHSLSTKLMGGNHNALAVFNHLCFYDEKSLSYLADHVGLKVKRIDYHGLDILDYLAYKEYADQKSYFENFREMVGPLQAILDNSRLSNCMRVLFQK